MDLFVEILPAKWPSWRTVPSTYKIGRIYRTRPMGARRLTFGYWMQITIEPNEDMIFEKVVA